MNEEEIWEKKILVSFIKLKHELDQFYHASGSHPNASQGIRKRLELLEQEFIDTLCSVKQHSFGLELLFKLNNLPYPRLWGYIIDQLAEYDSNDVHDYLTSLAGSKNIIPDLRKDGTTLNTLASKILASKGNLPISELKRSLDILFMIETAKTFPTSQWVPIYCQRMKELESEITGDHFWQSASGKFLANLGLILLFFAPTIDDQDIIQNILTNLLPSGYSAWFIKGFIKYVPEDLIKKHLDKYAFLEKDKPFHRVHPISSGLRRFENWKAPFLIKLFKHYADHISFSGNTYRGQQLDLDLLREVIITNASMNMIMGMLPLLSATFNDSRWKDYAAELVQEIGKKLSEDNEEIRDSLDQLFADFDSWSGKKG